MSANGSRPDPNAAVPTDPHAAALERTVALTKASGGLVSADGVLGLLYLLARDVASVGFLEKKLDEIAAARKNGTIAYSNGWLAKWAEFHAKRLQEPVAPPAAAPAEETDA